MKTYSVKEISDLLETNPETVRRWIRSGKIKAIQESKKNGNAITEEELKKFLHNSPKYSGIITGGMMALPLGLPVAISEVIGSLLMSYLDGQQRTKTAQASSKEIIKYLDDNITLHKRAIRQKDDTIEQLKKEILMERQQINSLQRALSMVKDNIELNDE